MIYHGNNDYRDYLAHHGVLGMHWGIRRYQPYGIGYQRKGGEKGRFIKTGLSSTKTTYGAKDQKVKKTKEPVSVEDLRKKSNTDEATAFAVRMALDIMALNPIGLAQDAYRLGRYVKGQAFVNKNIARLSKIDKVDEKTGFKLQETKMSADENMKYVNPEYHNFNTNSKNNCMLCTTAYELRMRGYEVQANKAAYGYSENSVKDWFPKAKVETITLDNNRTNALAAGFGVNKELTNKVTAALVNQGDGARGNLMVNWGGGAGHSVVYEVHNGSVIIRDCQSNKKYTNPGKFLSHSVSASYARLDDVDFDEEKIKEAVT